MSKIVDIKNRKKKVAEEVERIETLGQESEKKAVKWVKENTKEIQAKEKEKEAGELSRLDSKKKNIVSYKEELAKIIYDRLAKNLWPKGYKYLVNTSPKGIGIFIKNAQGKEYGRGMLVTFMPEYDLNAAVVLIIQADNTMAISDNLAKEVNGRITPV